nr:nitrilase-related carbon-nitrogen hydrolase [Spirochaeta isovalerica]
MKKIVLFLLLFVFTSFLYTKSVKVAAVQLRISEKTYVSHDVFIEEMEKRIVQAVNTFHPDLIVFPEYTSVFPAVTPYLSYAGGRTSVEEIFTAIGEDYSDIDTIRDLFVRESQRMETLMDRWGTLADKYDVTIVGGSYFAYDGEKLTNRLVVFGPDGNRIYSQDKFFLTDFETDILGLSSGSPEKPEGLILEDRKIVFTICRDTFLDRWETLYNGADLWIDIKANGETYGEEQVALFSRALPARLSDTEVPYGATVCLTGSFLELFWEGVSSFIGKTEEGVHTFMTTGSPGEEEILYFVLD